MPITFSRLEMVLKISVSDYMTTLGGRWKASQLMVFLYLWWHVKEEGARFRTEEVIKSGKELSLSNYY